MSVIGKYFETVETCIIKNTSPLLVGVKTGTAALGISTVISHEFKKQPISRPSNTTFEHISKVCSILPQGHVLNYVNNSIVCYSQKLETT